MKDELTKNWIIIQNYQPKIGKKILLVHQELENFLIIDQKLDKNQNYRPKIGKILLIDQKLDINQNCLPKIG